MNAHLELNLRPGVLRACRQMAAAERHDDLDRAEIVCDGGKCWVGDRRIGWVTVMRMLRLCLLHDDSDGSGCERYTLNEDGRALAANPEYVPRIVTALSSNAN